MCIVLCFLPCVLSVLKITCQFPALFKRINSPKLWSHCLIFLLLISGWLVPYRECGRWWRRVGSWDKFRVQESAGCAAKIDSYYLRKGILPSFFKAQSIFSVSLWKNVNNKLYFLWSEMIKPGDKLFFFLSSFYDFLIFFFSYRFARWGGCWLLAAFSMDFTPAVLLSFKSLVTTEQGLWWWNCRELKWETWLVSPLGLESSRLWRDSRATWGWRC